MKPSNSPLAACHSLAQIASPHAANDKWHRKIITPQKKNRKWSHTRKPLYCIQTMKHNAMTRMVTHHNAQSMMAPFKAQ
jgi:hypothetical protein